MLYIIYMRAMTDGNLQDQDAIDLTDNDITHLANFPLSPRLHTLLLARNRVAHIAPALPAALTNLSTLVLTANHIAELADLDPLAGFARLTHVVLLENPVTRREVSVLYYCCRNHVADHLWRATQHYRLYLIWRCPSVRFLDYQKVRDEERAAARALFGTAAEPSALASKVRRPGTAHEPLSPNCSSCVQISGIKSRTFDVPDSIGGALNGHGAAAATSGKQYRVQLTPKEKKRVEEMIRNAKSLAEIARLEKDLNEGRVPGGIAGGDAMEE